MPITLANTNTNWIDIGYTVTYDWQMDGVSEAIVKQKYVGEYDSAKLDEIEDAVGNTWSHGGGIQNLKCIEASGVVNNASIERTLVYKGVEANSVGETVIKASLTKESIETHQDFESFAGTVEDPKNGAIFNDDGTFSHFESLEEHCPDRQDSQVKFGIKYYLEPTLTVEQTTYKSTQTFNTPEVGKIEDPSSIDAYGDTTSISLPKRNFLVIGEDASFFGNGIKNTKSYLLSGFNAKWNDLIYE